MPYIVFTIICCSITLIIYYTKYESLIKELDKSFDSHKYLVRCSTISTILTSMWCRFYSVAYNPEWWQGTIWHYLEAAEYITKNWWKITVTPRPIISLSELERVYEWVMKDKWLWHEDNKKSLSYFWLPEYHCRYWKFNKIKE